MHSTQHKRVVTPVKSSWTHNFQGRLYYSELLFSSFGSKKIRTPYATLNKNPTPFPLIFLYFLTGGAFFFVSVFRGSVHLWNGFIYLMPLRGIELAFYFFWRNYELINRNRTRTEIRWLSIKKPILIPNWSGFSLCSQPRETKNCSTGMSSSSFSSNGREGTWTPDFTDVNPTIS